RDGRARRPHGPHALIHAPDAPRDRVPWWSTAPLDARARPGRSDAPPANPAPPPTGRESSVSGTVAAPTGITDPPIDRLLERADSKYALVLFSAKRARQINAYYAQLNEGLLEYVGPLVETRPQEKPLSIAMREIDAGLLTVEPTTEPAATES